MTFFLKSGNAFRVASNEAMDVRTELPSGNYTVCKDQSGQLFLEHIGNFTPPKKIYGDAIRHTNRIITTFLDRPSSTGVMMTGEKGSGKTLLTKNVSIELAKKGIPTIVINAPWCGDGFNTLVQSIDQPCALLFDEFEKVYDREEQEQILTLLDGVFPSKKLFMFTCNDKWRVDAHMRNRPGRIFYMLDFKGLDENFIREYCYDNLNNKNHIDKVCQIAGMFSEFNFDMLQSFVEEMNRYKESPADALQLLNAKPDFDQGTKYEVVIVFHGKVIDTDDRTTEYTGNPLNPDGINISFDPDPDNSDTPWKQFNFKHPSLVSMDSKAGKFIFEDHGCRVVLSKQVKQYFDFGAF